MKKPSIFSAQLLTLFSLHTFINVSTGISHMHMYRNMTINNTYTGRLTKNIIIDTIVFFINYRNMSRPKTARLDIT